MTFEPEWLFLDELLALLGPSPDIQTVEARFGRALDEGVLQDRDRTPAEVWHERFENGVVCFLWGRRTILVPWFDRGWREWRVKEIRPQFRRSAWLELFSDLLSGVTQATAPQQQSDAEITQEVGRWYRDEFVPSWASDKPPSEPDEMHTARQKFPDVKNLRDLVRQARAKFAPKEWRQPGPRRSRKTPVSNLAGR
jgi:hypothetical protein